MGTRHLICVMIDNEYKIAQYGQWDGYPSGQGVSILDFLKKYNLDIFKEQLKFVSWATEEELDEQWVNCGVELGEAWVGFDEASLHKKFYPENSRDTGSGILKIVYDYIPNDKKKSLKLFNDLKFAGDSLFCEYAYVIDFDKNTFEIYKGFNRYPLDVAERFSTMPVQEKGNYKGAEQYYPVRFMKSYDLNNLPSQEQFLSDLEPQEEEE